METLIVIGMLLLSGVSIPLAYGEPSDLFAKLYVRRHNVIVHAVFLLGSAAVAFWAVRLLDFAMMGYDAIGFKIKIMAGFIIAVVASYRIRDTKKYWKEFEGARALGDWSIVLDARANKEAETQKRRDAMAAKCHDTPQF